jgi:hypothetical protein
MFTRALPAAMTVLSLAGVAVASDALPAVETMTCDQMLAEMTVAGQQMNARLDPEFAREAQAMADQAGLSTGAVVGGVGQAIMCSLPGIGLFCAITSQAPSMGQAGATEENIARMTAQMERLQRAMEGLDMVRLQTMSERFEAQKCQVPQDGAPPP